MLKKPNHRMASIIPSEKHLFSKVKVAREILRERADELINEYLDVAKQAKVAGDYESAYKALQWIIDHIPADTEGNRIVDSSVDKTPAQVGPSQPKIQIGIQLGGVKQKELPTVESERIPEKVIDAKKNDPS